MTNASAEPRPVIVRETPIELYQVIKFRGLAGSDGGAKRSISESRAVLTGAVENQEHKRFAVGDRVGLLKGQTFVVQLA